MNINLRNSIKMASIKLCLKARYNSLKKRNKNAKILRIILTTEDFGDIEFDSGKINTRGALNYEVLLRSTKNNYELDFSVGKYFLKPKLINNILYMYPHFIILQLYDRLEDYKLNINNCVLKFYLSEDGKKDLEKIL